MILQLLLRQMSTELLCNEWRLRTQDHLVLLLTPQQVCEELLYNERRLRSQDPESPPSPICPGYPGSPGCSVSRVSLSIEPTREYGASVCPRGPGCSVSRGAPVNRTNTRI